MSADWASATLPILVASVALIAPGLLVIISGWGLRRPGMLFFAPAVSVGVIAVAAVAAPFVGLRWSVLPVAIMTLVAAGVAFGLRRWVGREPVPRPGRGAVVASIAGFVLAAVALTLQTLYAFVGPDAISQTFDAIVHLNSVAWAVDTGNASAFNVGLTSGVGFYPNGWHSVAALVAQATGAHIALAVNAANIAIAAVAWPASCLALGFAFFGDRPAAIVATAALSTGFGAFPLLLFYFGVLYPNLTAYALLPAGIAAVIGLLGASSLPTRARAATLTLVVALAIALSHPNAFLALCAVGSALSLWILVGRAIGIRTRRTWLWTSGILLALLVGGAVLWYVSRTPYELSRWGAWQSTAQAVGEAALVAPGAYPITLLTAALMIVGLFASVIRPRLRVVLVPFFVVASMFVLAAGVPTGTLLRELVTSPWYNDPFRLAALLPIAAVPVATAGAVTIVDGVIRLRRRVPGPGAIWPVLAVVASLGLFTVSFGPNVMGVAASTRAAYSFSDGSALLTTNELAVIERLGTTTDDNALIIGNPWTGTSLAYALGGREVVEKHIFGPRSDDAAFLDANLVDIDSDPLVCDAVARLGVDYVLDFGSQNVFGLETPWADRPGLNDLTPSEHLVLVDSEGSDARLFRIEGC
jgi:hypothetical protein